MGFNAAKSDVKQGKRFSTIIQSHISISYEWLGHSG